MAACSFTSAGSSIRDQERRESSLHTSTRYSRPGVATPVPQPRKLNRYDLASYAALLVCRSRSALASVSAAPSSLQELATSQPTELLKAQKAVVVGAGPAGSTVAMYLARRGFHVEVYEKRFEPKADQVDKARSYIIALAARGIHALENVGVHLPVGENRYLGTVMHPFKGKQRVSASGTANSTEASVSLERVDLAQILIDNALRMYPGRIKYHFGCACDDLDLENKQIFLASEDGITKQVKYDLLVAADGASSTVRGLLTRRDPNFTFKATDSGRQYKTFKNLQADLEPPEFKSQPGRTIHLWLGNTPLTSLSAHRNPDGSYSGTMALKNGDFDRLQSAEDYEALIRKSVRGVPDDWIPQVAQQCLYAPTSSSGRRIQCSALHVPPGVILIGDAAHAVTPVGGQGCNSALEDCEVLDKVLEQSGNDVDKIVSNWTAVRHADAIALTNLEGALYSLIGSSPMRFLNPKFLRIAVHLALGTLRHKLMPFWFGPPAMSGLGSRKSYAEIERSINKDTTIVLAGLFGIFVFAAAKALRSYFGAA